jgi:hypothetical protein
VHLGGGLVGLVSQHGGRVHAAQRIDSGGTPSFGAQGLSDLVMGLAGAIAGAMSRLIVAAWGYSTLDRDGADDRAHNVFAES